MVAGSPRSPRSDTVANGAAIRAIREARGIPLGECATTCGISYSYLSNIEAGRKNASPALLRRLADALGCQLAAISSPREQRPRRGGYAA